MGQWFELNETRPLKWHVGVKLDTDHEQRALRMTQPVMIQSFKDEFDSPGEMHPDPAKAGEVLEAGKPEEKSHGKCRNCTEKVLENCCT